MKKLWQMIKGCPLFTILILSGIIVTAGGYVGAALGIYKWDISFEHPMIQTVLMDEKAESGSQSDASEVTTAAGDSSDEDIAADDSDIKTTEKSTDKSDTKTTEKGTDKSDTKTTEKSTEKTDDKTTEKSTEKTGDKTTEKSTEKTGDKTTEKSTEKTDTKTTEKTTEKKAAIDTGGSAAPISRPTQYKKIKTRKSRNSCYGDLTQIALETDYPYIKVDKSYFDDALFIGDSRVEGLALYSGLDNAQFAYMEGLTTFGLMSEKIARNGTATLTDLLSSQTFKKIYIMLGINEAGYATDSYVSTYMDAISQIQALQPDAVIFMMGCMHVSSDYSDTHDIVNNDNIDEKNGAIAAYADGIKLFYLDMNTVVDDGKGGLIKDYTWDDIHLQAQYYSVWEDYLYSHGLKDEAFN